MTPSTVTVDIQAPHADLVMQLVQRGMEASAIPMNAAERAYVSELSWSLQMLAGMHRTWVRRSELETAE